MAFSVRTSQLAKGVKRLDPDFGRRYDNVWRNRYLRLSRQTFAAFVLILRCSTNIDLVQCVEGGFYALSNFLFVPTTAQSFEG